MGSGDRPWSGGLPREWVVAENFVPALESLSSLGFEERNPGCPRNFAGMSRTPGGVQKVCAKKLRAHFSFPTIKRNTKETKGTRTEKTKEGNPSLKRTKKKHQRIRRSRSELGNGRLNCHQESRQNEPRQRERRMNKGGEETTKHGLGGREKQNVP